jgi:Helix-turn-helix domain
MINFETAHARTIEDVVRISKLGRTMVYNQIKCGNLKARKCGRRTLVLDADLQRFLTSLPATNAA